MSQTLRVNPLCAIERMLKPRVGETWEVSSARRRLTSVVLPALSRPLRGGKEGLAHGLVGRGTEQGVVGLQHEDADLAFL